MNNRRFEWDENKRKQNRDKHGIDFGEATSVFDDDNAILLYDEINSADEERYILIGYSEKVKMLMVCHCYRSGDGEIIRIISARSATSRERKMYWRR